MEVADILHQMMEDSMRAFGMTDLTVGTVVSESPLKVKTREEMDELPEEILWLTAAVIEKKIPILEHFHTTKGFRHGHGLPDLSHTHSGAEGDTGAALEGSMETETALNQDAFDSDKRLLEREIVCYEDGKPLLVEDGYIILNRKLEEGDKVLLLRVCRGQQFIILSRIFERGAQRAASI